MKKETIINPFEPIFDKDSKVLILGSLPSPKSREIGMYYGNPKNRFWLVLSDILSENYPQSNEAKRNLALTHHIALWDVISSCEINGASDSSIKNAQINNIEGLIKQTKIKIIFTLGATATNLLKKHTNLVSIQLPSTSPANCAVKYEDLKMQFKQILQFIN